MDKITVLNRALGFLGERTIVNPDNPETLAGKHITSYFDQGRREVLRRYPWNFAESWIEIPKTTAPSMHFSDAYSLPQDFIRLLVVGDFDRPNRDYRMITQGAPDYRRVIALNNAGKDTLQIAYVPDIDLLSMWDPLALKVLALWLALDAAQAITGQDGKVQTINGLLTEELKDAVNVDGQEQAVRDVEWSAVQDARRSANFGSFGFTDVRGFY